MTFATLLSGLDPFDPNAPLIFEVAGQAIGAGYHVTELRHSASTGIDCGGKVETWDEARLQLLDGPGAAHMSVGKFRGISKKSMEALPKLAEASLLVEFSPDNLGLKLMHLGEPRLKDGCVYLELRESKATCKPAARTLGHDSSAVACCGTTTSASGCCGSDKGAATREVCCA